MVFASLTTSTNQIVAIVNNNVILKDELDQMIRILKSQENNVKNFVYFNNQYLLRQTLEHLIINSILSQEINAYKDIHINNKQVDQEIFNIAFQNRMSVEQMHKNLILNKVDYSIYRSMIKKEIQINEALKNIVQEKINIVPEDMNTLDFNLSIKRSMQKKFNIDLIYIPLLKNFSKKDINKQNSLIQNLILEIKKNNTIDNLIVKNIDQSISKTEKTGWINIENIPSPFNHVIIDAKKGDIFGPIKTNIGFYILKIKDLFEKQKKFFINEVHVRHIMLKKTFLTEKQIKNKLEKISSDIKNKKITFDDAVKMLSEDIETKHQGGDLGWYELDLFNSHFQNAISKMKIGAISKPIYSMFGWHIIQLLEKRKVDKTEQIKKQYAYQILLNNKIYDEMQALIEELRNNAYVKIF